MIYYKKMISSECLINKLIMNCFEFDVCSDNKDNRWWATGTVRYV